MTKRFPLYPAVDSALVTTNALFGVDITKPKFPSDEDREIADNFDVAKELEKAIEARNLTVNIHADIQKTINQPIF